MRFTCEKNALMQGLNIAGRTVAQKSSLSAIEGILCRAGTGISLTGYNMETAITYQISADVSDQGECVFPKLFSDIIRRSAALKKQESLPRAMPAQPPRLMASSIRPGSGSNRSSFKISTVSPQPRNTPKRAKPPEVKSVIAARKPA